MKLENNLKSFADILSQELLGETNANYGSAIGGISSGPMKKDKYSPATIEQVPSIRFRNDAIHMGQPESATDAQSNFIYPFQSVFSELIDAYVKLNELREMVGASKELPTLTVEKKKLVELTLKNLTFSINELKLSIENIEKLTF